MVKGELPNFEKFRIFFVNPPHNSGMARVADTSLYDTLGIRPSASDAEIRKVRPLRMKNGIQRIPFYLFSIIAPHVHFVNI